MKKLHPATVLKYIVLIFLGIIDFYPFFWVLCGAFKTKTTIFSEPFALPKTLNFGNFVEAWQKCGLSTNFFNSVLYASCSVVLIVLFSSMAAFVLTHVIDSKAIYAYFTLGIMVPLHAILIPSFIIMRSLTLYNTRYGFIILMIAANLSFSIFVMTSFMKTLPKELDEAALIDGCGYGRLFVSIVFPLAKPGIATVGTLALLNCWNEYLFAYIMLMKEDNKTITQGIFAMVGKYSTDYAGMCAGLVIAILPMMTFFHLFQEQVIDGMTVGAVKG